MGVSVCECVSLPAHCRNHMHTHALAHKHKLRHWHVHSTNKHQHICTHKTLKRQTHIHACCCVLWIAFSFAFCFPHQRRTQLRVPHLTDACCPEQPSGSHQASQPAVCHAHCTLKLTADYTEKKHSTYLSPQSAQLWRTRIAPPDAGAGDLY